MVHWHWQQEVKKSSCWFLKGVCIDLSEGVGYDVLDVMVCHWSGMFQNNVSFCLCTCTGLQISKDGVCESWWRGPPQLHQHPAAAHTPDLHSHAASVHPQPQLWGEQFLFYVLLPMYCIVKFVVVLFCFWGWGVWIWSSVSTLIQLFINFMCMLL